MEGNLPFIWRYSPLHPSVLPPSLLSFLSQTIKSVKQVDCEAAQDSGLQWTVRVESVCYRRLISATPF